MTGIVSMSNLESETEFALWALFGGPLIVATDIRNMSNWKKSVLLNSEIIAINQDELVLPGRRIRGVAGGPQLWSKTLANGDQAVVFYNAGDIDSVDISISWDEIGFPIDSTVNARDLWAHSTVPGSPFTSGATAKGIIPHGNAMWRVSKV